jgi:hypothetical protein
MAKIIDKDVSVNAALYVHIAEITLRYADSEHFMAGLPTFLLTQAPYASDAVDAESWQYELRCPTDKCAQW